MQRYKSTLLVTICFVIVALASTPVKSQAAQVTGEMKKWHRITLTFTGPHTSEKARPNPFLDYRLDVMFKKGNKQYIVPGYYAADGFAAQTSASAGNKWRVHFVPDEIGQWSYIAKFVKGENVALGNEAGTPVSFDAAKGSFNISATDKKGRDHRAKGMLQYVGKRYLLFAETGEFFLKGGADSPENFLAYADFDNTYDSGALRRSGEAAGDEFIHHYQPHIKDWKPGDPTWKNGKGKGMIGALNYLASKGMNSVYFIPYNIDGGDGKDVWPWIEPDEKFRFDCSKLDQWEIVFSHMDKLGLMLHIIQQEQENDQGLDAGELGPQRRLYYRELIARFGHHLALVWNLGEENTNTYAQRRDFCRYIKEIDPYDHPIVCHTFPGRYDEIYTPLLGYEYFDGPSLQTNDTHNQTLAWLDRSACSGRQWFVCLDEIGPAHTGVKPDKDDPQHDEVRKKHLWGNLMAGGAGVEWYFGYKFAHNDLNCEDWRSRENMWDQTRYALEFFNKNLPFTHMTHHDELTSASDDYCFAEPGRIYAIYLPNGGTTKLDLGNYTGTFSVKWYNPRRGGDLKDGGTKQIRGPGAVPIGLPPEDNNEDWAVLIKLKP
jgi:hypothetical protein